MTSTVREGCFKVRQGIRTDSRDTEPAFPGGLIKLRPHAAHDLRQDRSAVVVGFEPAIIVSDDQQHRNTAVVFGQRVCRLRAIEPSKNELERRFGGQAAGLD